MDEAREIFRQAPDRDRTAMVFTLAAMLALSGSAPLDCLAAERRVAEFSRSLRADIDGDSEAGWRLEEFVEETHAVAPVCAETKLVPILIDLLGDPRMSVARQSARALWGMGEQSASALPALRSALTRARAADRASIEKRRAAGDPYPEVGASDYERDFTIAIERIEQAHASPPRWEDGMCARMVRPGATGDFEWRVALKPLLAADCRAEALTNAKTFPFHSDRLAADDAAIPPQVFEAWTQLSQFIESGISARQLCIDSQRGLSRAGLRLADMRVKWVSEINRKDAYGVGFEWRDPRSDAMVDLSFGFKAGRPIRATEIKPDGCD